MSTTMTAQASDCPFCLSPSAAEDSVRCPRCQTPHHRDCYEFCGGCAVLGCAGQDGGSAAPDTATGAGSPPAASMPAPAGPAFASPAPALAQPTVSAAPAPALSQPTVSAAPAPTGGVRGAGAASRIVALVAVGVLAAGAGSALTWQAMSTEVAQTRSEGSQEASEARAEGYSEGYREGLSETSSTAADQYVEGYEKGKGEGYDEGYADGLAASPGPDATPESETGTASGSEWSSGVVWVDELEHGETDSDSVRRLQWALAQAGFDVDITGNYLDETDEAVRAWQRSIGNEPDPAGSSSLGRVQAERLFAQYPGMTVL